MNDGGEPPMEDRQAARAARGAFWAVLYRPSLFVIETARNIVLARLLLPREHGLFGIAVVASMLVGAFSDSGFSLALIQRRQSVGRYLDTAWTVSALLGAAAGAVLFLGAPPFAALAGQPEAVPLIRAYALIRFVDGLRSIAEVELQRRLDLKRWFAIQVAGPLAGLAVGIVAALAWRDAWALWAGALAGALAGTLASFLLLPWRPAFQLDLEKARELFRFGRWVLAGNVLRVLFHQADDLVVARMLGTTALGHYRRSYGWANLPAYQILGVASTLGLPLFARLQGEPARMLEGLRQALRWVSLFSFPSLLAIVALAPRLVGPVLGEPWIPMIPALQVLAAWGVLRSLATPFVAVAQALNRPDVAVSAALIKLLLFAAMIVPLTGRWGILGTSAAVVAASAVELPLLWRRTLRLIGGPGAGRALLRDPLILAGCAASMGGAMAATLHALGPTPGLAGSLAASLAAGTAGALALVLATWVADRYLGLGVWAMVRRQISLTGAPAPMPCEATPTRPRTTPIS